MSLDISTFWNFAVVLYSYSYSYLQLDFLDYSVTPVLFSNCLKNVSSWNVFSYDSNFRLSLWSWIVLTTLNLSIGASAVSSLSPQIWSSFLDDKEFLCLPLLQQSTWGTASFPSYKCHMFLVYSYFTSILESVQNLCCLDSRHKIWNTYHFSHLTFPSYYWKEMKIVLYLFKMMLLQ